MLTLEQIYFLNKVVEHDSWEYINGVVDTYYSVHMNNMKLTRIPVKFGTIRGNFKCDQNLLTSLENGPVQVHGYFDCAHNQLTSLEGGPIHVGNFYSCSHNKSTSLIGAPKILQHNFWCDQNKLTSLEGCPKLDGDLNCRYNPNLYILYGITEIKYNVYYDNQNDLNEWIIQQTSNARHVTYKDIAQWIAENNRFKLLLYSCTEIRQYFSSDILRMVELGILC